MEGGNFRQMPYASIASRVKEAARRAGIRKRVWSYLLRHSRITPASTRLSYAEMCHVFGWKLGSDMPQFYVHLAGEERDSAYLKMNGLQPQDNGHSNGGKYVAQSCPRCKAKSSPDSKFCNACGLAFDLKYAIGQDKIAREATSKMDRLMSILASKPEVVSALIDAIGPNQAKD